MAAGLVATQHLVDIGCKTIAHIRRPETSPDIQRLEGYREILKLAGRPLKKEYVIYEAKGDVGSLQRGAEAMRQLASCKVVPEGVFCFNDPLAMGAVNEAVRQGLKIPKDIAIVYCGSFHYDSLRVPLSSDQHSHRIGKEAASLLLATLKGMTAPKPKTILLPPELVVRASTQR